MKSIKAEGRVLGWVVETIKCVNIRTLSFAKKAHIRYTHYFQQGISLFFFALPRHCSLHFPYLTQKANYGEQYFDIFKI